MKIYPFTPAPRKMMRKVVCSFLLLASYADAQCPLSGAGGRANVAKLQQLCCEGGGGARGVIIVSLTSRTAWTSGGGMITSAVACDCAWNSGECSGESG